MMKAKSVASTQMDPYRAGVELGEALKEVDPEVVFLFTTIHYGNVEEISEAIYDVLGREDLLLVGTSGDGFYEQREVGEVGVSALGINAEGRAKWQVVSETRVAEDTYGATLRCIKQLKERFASDELSLAYLVSDFHADGNALMRALDEHLSVPVVGGFAGDDRKMQQCVTMVNRKVLKDGMVMLGIGGEMAFTIYVATGLTKIGKEGKVTLASRTRLFEVNGQPAMAFVEEQSGCPVTAVDKGITAFRVVDPVDPAHCYQRSIADFNEADGSVELFGGVEENAMVQLCHAYPEEIIREVRDVGREVIRDGFVPQAGIVISCAGRKWVLGNRISHEVTGILEAIGHSFPLAGFPSFGEIGPLRQASGYTKNLFHNVTYVVLLFGQTGEK